MHSRIKELMLEAGYAAPEAAGRAIKFTELLVRECSRVCSSVTEPHEETTWADVCAITVLEHFGFKNDTKSN